MMADGDREHPVVYAMPTVHDFYPVPYQEHPALGVPDATAAPPTPLSQSSIRTGRQPERDSGSRPTSQISLRSQIQQVQEQAHFQQAHPRGTSPPGYDAGKYGGFAAVPLGDGAENEKRAARPVRRSMAKVLWFWSWELLALLVALLLMIAIIAILAHYDGQKVPEWPLSINLSTLIALLSTVFRASMLLVVAEILGQIKWSWFSEKPRPLNNLSDFDRARQGVIGGTRLVGLMLWRGGSAAGLLALFAAFVVVVSLAVGPFTQQALRTVSCPTSDAEGNASIPVAHFVPGTSGYSRFGAGQYDTDYDMKGAMIQGFSNPSGNDSSIVATCPTGNCSFPDYGMGYTHASIGICSRCIDITSKAVFTSNTSNVVLPNGLTVTSQWTGAAGINAWLNVTTSVNPITSPIDWAADLYTAAFKEGLASSVINITILSITNTTCSNSTGTIACGHNITAANAPKFIPATDDTGLQEWLRASDYIAGMCTIYPCLRKYLADVTNGVLNEQLVSETPALLNSNLSRSTGPTVASIYTNYTAVRTPCMLNGSSTWYTDANITSPTNLTDASTGRYYTQVWRNNAWGYVPDQCVHQMYGPYVEALSQFMQGTTDVTGPTGATGLFSGSCTYYAAQGYRLHCPNANWWLYPLWNNKMATLASINQNMWDFTTAVTNKFRTTGRGPDSNPADTKVLGVIHQTTVCNAFDWRWLVLPLALMVMSAVLLVWIMIKNYEDPSQPIWKGSSLPLLLYGMQSLLPHHPHDDDEPEAPRRAPTMRTIATAASPVAMNLDQVEAIAKRTMVRFQAGEDTGFVRDVGGLPFGPASASNVSLDSFQEHEPGTVRQRSGGGVVHGRTM